MTTRSMTAFARSEAQGEWGSLVWELRSVNHRYLEVSLRLPEEFRALEPAFREMIQKALGRGKVDGGLRYRSGPGVAAGKVEVNESLARSVVDAVNKVQSLMGLTSAAINPVDILRWPDVVTSQPPDLSAVREQSKTLLTTCLEQFISAREGEGERMGEVIRARCDQLEVELGHVAEHRQDLMTHLRNRLQNRLAELDVEADPGRLEQELVIQAQRLDVDEELERLRSHIAETRDVLGRDEPVGRRLDFLMQEFNREANTLGSKSSDTATTQAAVEMKVLIEQMREQVQNIE